MLLFVYGTLLSKAENHDLIRGAKLVGKGMIRAALFELSVGFPAILLEPGKTYGEVYEADDDLLEELDEFEGYYPDRPEDCVYFRKAVEVSMSDGTKCEAEVYYMDRDQLARFSAEYVPNGKWGK